MEVKRCRDALVLTLIVISLMAPLLLSLSLSSPTTSASPVPGAWEVLPANPFAVVNGGGAACYAENMLSGKRYIYYLENKAHPAWLYRFDIDENRWENLGTNAGVGFAAGMGMVWTRDDYLYIQRGGTARPNFWRYKISENLWENLADSENIASGSTLAWGGGDNIWQFSRSTNKLAVFKISENKWENVTSVPESSTGAGGSLTVHGGYVYYTPGVSPNSRNFYRYKIADGTWETLAPLPVEVGGWGAAAALENVSEKFIYALVGRTTVYFLRYSVPENKWVRKADLPATITWGGERLAFDGAYLYVVRGVDNQFWRYEVESYGVDVSISPDFQEGRPGETLNYTVTVKNNGNATDTFDLVVEETLAWGASVSPTALTIGAGENAQATLSVTVPSNAKYCETNSITVRATSRGDTCTKDEYTVTAHVELVCGVSVEVEPALQENWPGGSLEFTVRARNTGNAVDNILLSVVPVTGWPDIYVSPEVLAEREPGEENQAKLYVTIPSDAESCTTVQITIVAKSQRCGAENSAIATVHVVYGVKVAVLPENKSGGRGAILEYKVIVTNLRGEIDNYALQVSDTAGWERSLSLSTLEVPASENRSAMLSVKVPADAYGGLSNTITVVATSVTDNTVSSSATCVAYVVVERDVGISISPSSRAGSPGQTLSFAVSVKNKGNVHETFVLEIAGGVGWSPTLSHSSLSLAMGETRSAMLTVTVPADAADGDSTTIIVYALSTADGRVCSSASCTAIAVVAAPPEVGPSGPSGPALEEIRRGTGVPTAGTTTPPGVSAVSPAVILAIIAIAIVLVVFLVKVFLPK